MEENYINNLVSTFFIGETRWGINIMNTQEVIKIPHITKVHNAPEYVDGIINLRGRIVTVISLCRKLKIPSAGDSPESRIIIVDENDEYIGIMVDRISDVIEVDRDSLKPAPATVNGTKGKFFEGIFHKESLTIAILNLNRVLSGDDDEQ